MMDKAKQRQVWQRVYGQPGGSKLSRREVELCYRRALTNHQYFDRCREDPVYGAAFARLAEETLEHCRMLLRILER